MNYTRRPYDYYSSIHHIFDDAYRNGGNKLLRPSHVCSLVAAMKDYWPSTEERLATRTNEPQTLKKWFWLIIIVGLSYAIIVCFLAGVKDGKVEAAEIISLSKPEHILAALPENRIRSGYSAYERFVSEQGGKQ